MTILNKDTMNEGYKRGDNGILYIKNFFLKGHKLF